MGTLSISCRYIYKHTWIHKCFSSGLFQRKKYSASNSAACSVLHLFPSCQSFYSISCLFKLLLSAILLISLVKNKLISNNNHGGKNLHGPSLLPIVKICPKTSVKVHLPSISFSLSIYYSNLHHQVLISCSPLKILWDFSPIFQFFFNTFTFYTHILKKQVYTLFNFS